MPASRSRCAAALSAVLFRHGFCLLFFLWLGGFDSRLHFDKRLHGRQAHNFAIVHLAAGSRSDNARGLHLGTSLLLTIAAKRLAHAVLRARRRFSTRTGSECSW